MNTSLDTFAQYESQVRSYCRAFPTVFNRAKDSYLFDDNNNCFIDFFSGAGALNYGHNNEKIKAAVLKYIEADGLMMSLDFHSSAKQKFIDIFQKNILAPRGLNYKLQFTSPTGTSVVESAIKLARKITGRQNVIAFTNAYHGMTGISLSLTGNKYHRQAISYSSITRFPYDNYLGEGVDTIAYYRKMLSDPSSGVDLPAAIILETVQGEGGLNIASINWLRELRKLADDFNILLIVDDVQAGCGRTGKFFSFERADIQPDMVCLSKSIGGMGFPLAILLLNGNLDVWAPGEDNGTFRGNNIAFVAATEMLKLFWQDFAFEREISAKADIIQQAIRSLANKYPDSIAETRGIGLMQGLEFISDKDTRAVAKLCFQKNLIIETCGNRDQVLKIMPSLTIPIDVLKAGLTVIEEAVSSHFGVTEDNNTVNQSCEDALV